MKKLAKSLIFVLFMSSIIIPVLPVVAAPKTSQPLVYRSSSAAAIVSGNWDPVVTDGYNILGSYFYAACEYPMSGYADYWAGLKGKTKEEEWYPQLVTNWTTTYRTTVGTNSYGFNNTGGRESIEFELRDGVTFHDGSAWNATVFKWNIDRHYLINANLTGNANGIFDQRNTANIWDPYGEWLPYFTPTWNLSEYEFEWAHYYVGDPANPANKRQNPMPIYYQWVWNGTAFVNTTMYSTPYAQIPMVRWVEITQQPTATEAGRVKVHWNSWNSYGMEGAVWVPQISYDAYHEDYTDTGIYGYDNDAPGAPAAGHFIGTGPWVYDFHDELADRGRMTKNMDWWNRSAVEADGLFDAEVYELVQFAPGDLGRDARNIALLAHEIDYAYDSMTMPIDYDAVMADPNINYEEDYVSEYQTQITLNSINETWWSGGRAKEFWYWDGGGWVNTWNYSWTPADGQIYGFDGLDLSNITAWYGNEKGFEPPDANGGGRVMGIPRALRKALNYAFDHDTLINVDLNGRAVRGGGVVGVANVFYNASVPLPGYNLTYAREVLLTQNGIDPYSLTQEWWPINYTALLAARGLDENSTDAQWQNIADTNPIDTLNFYWDDAHQDLADTFERACNNLGVALVQDADNKMPQGKIIWDTVGSYWSLNFDGESSIWSASAWPMDYHMPMTIPEGWIAANYADPDRGTWRTAYTPTGSSPAYWPTWNFGFNYDSEIDEWIGYMYNSEPHRKKEYIGKIANKEQNELYSMIWTYQTKGGWALWGDWEVGYRATARDGRSAPFWGGVSIAFLNYDPLTPVYPLIPGAPLIMTLTATAVSMVGIIFILMRKKKLR
ncbi:MAG: hypothetical protein ACW98X_15775 [Promethearchaeota archaeon]|jgi:ABC-type transport system substrate-binding protein